MVSESLEYSILATVKRILSEHLDIPEDSIESRSYLVDDLGMDSVAALEVLCALQEEYGIEAPREDLSGIETVQDIVRFTIWKTADRKPRRMS